MGNIFCLKEDSPPEDWLCLSNRASDVLIQVLVLSGSALAETEGEKRLIVWLGEKDQAQVGLGTIGFDIVDMPWQRETFQEDRAFLLRVIQAAGCKLGWEKLDYTPEYPSVLAHLEKLRTFVEGMTEGNIDELALSEWLHAAQRDDPVNCGFPRCKKHGTLLTFLGCQFCGSTAKERF